MDKQLLKALDNLSNALEMIAEALEKKDSGGGSSATTTALQGGDFGKSLEQINLGIKSIKVDTQQILKQQQTILGMQKKKDDDKKTGLFGEAGENKERENKMKKGIGIILLIAIAVLAIGMAFKLVGKIDFLSVIGLSIAILVMAVAFEKVAKLKISLREAFETSAVLVFIAIAITVSSWIMKLIAPIGFTQFLTAVFISITFAAMSKYLENIFLATIIFKRLRVKSTDLIKTLVAISAAITASSWIMRLIMPISFAQGLTAILISVTFAIIAMNFEKIAIGVSLFENTGVKPKDLLMVMLGIAAAITFSSWIMKLIMPLSIGQLITGVLISTMFLLISFNLEKIAIGVVAFQKTGVKAKDLLLVMVGIAAAITASSWVMQLIMPIGLWQFVTALGITILFAIMSYIMPELAGGIALVGRLLGVNKVFLIPLVMVAISLAIMLSSLLLQFTAPIPFMELLRILVFSVVLAIATVVVGFAAFILAVVFKLKNIEKGSVAIVILAVAIMAASQILAIGRYDVYIDWKWTLQTMAAILGFGLVAFLLNKVGSIKDYIIGSLLILVVAAALMVVSHILAVGNYKNYPSLKWAAGVGLSLLAFIPAILVLGLVSMADAGVSTLLGSLMVVVVSIAIMAVSHILALGKYDKIIPLKWVASTVLTLLPFAIMAVALGVIALTGIGAVAIVAGLALTALVAITIVETDKIIRKGKYDKYPKLEWVLSVGAAMAGFGLAVLALGLIALTGIGAIAILAGVELVPMIAKTIVDTDKIIRKGNYSKYPGINWAISVGGLMTVFGLAVLTLGSFVVGSFGLGYVALKAGQSAVKIIAQSIVDVANIFSKNRAAFKNGPPKAWAEGVGIAIGAFSPVYGMLQKNATLKLFGGGGVGPKDFARAIRVVSEGIITAAEIFAKNKSKFDKGKYPSVEWGKGVGGAINAFAPVFKALNEDTGWFTSGDDVIANITKGIIAVTRAIVRVGSIFGGAKSKFEFYPTSKWSDGVKVAVEKFVALSKYLTENEDVEFWRVKDVAYRVVKVAQIFSNNKRHFEIKPNLLQKWGTNIKEGMKIFINMAEYLTLKKATQFYRVQDIAYRMVRVAKIFQGSEKAFQVKIDPNYMKNMSQNMLDFNELVKKLAASESEGGGFFGRLSDAAEGLMGTDPISQIAKRMITLAKGYDAMANALIKLSFAMRMLKVDSMKKLAGYTRAMMGKKAIEDEGEKGTDPRGPEFSKSFSMIGSKKETSVSPGANPIMAKGNKNSIFYVSERLEELIKIMANIERQTSTIDEGMEKLAGIKPPPEKSDFG